MAQSDKIRQAVMLARRDGNAQAAGELMTMLKATEAEENSPVAGMGSLQKALVGVGSGLESAWQGAKQLVGQGPTADEQAEKQRLMAPIKEDSPWLVGGGELAGEMAATAVPGAGGAAAGMRAARGLSRARQLATAGAASGVASAPLAEGRAGQEMADKMWAAGAGAGAGAALPAVLPAARRGITKAREMFSPERKAARMTQELADDPAAALARLETYDSAQAVGGLSPAQISADPKLLGAERLLKDAGGEIGAPLRAAEQRANQARYERTMDVLPDDQAVERAVQGPRDVAATMLPMRIRGDLLNTGRTGQALDDAIAKSIGPSRRELLKLRSAFRDAVQISNSTKDASEIHNWRKLVSDSITGAKATGRPGLAGDLDAKLQPLKATLDSEMDNLTRGSWNDFMSQYRGAAADRSQAQAGNKLRDVFNAARTDSQGNPLMSSMAGRVRKINSPEAPLVDRYGSPVYSPGVSRHLEQLGGELEAAAAGQAPDIVGRGSATAGNLQGMQDLMKRAGRADTPGGLFPTVGALGGGIPGAAAGWVAQKLIPSITDAHSRRVATHMVQNMNSRDEMIRLLRDMIAKQQVTAAQARDISKVIQATAQAGGQAGATIGGQQ